MPRVVRKWWIHGFVDGKKSAVGFGPRTTDGGFVLELTQRDGGKVEPALRLEGWVSPEHGMLHLTVRDHNDRVIYKKVSYR